MRTTETRYRSGLLRHVALVLLAAASAPAWASPGANSPEGLLRELYAAHRPWADAGLDLEDPAVVARWFCPSMQQAFANHARVVAACPEGELCGLDYDPILSAQDYGDGAGFDLRIEALPPPAQHDYAVRFRLFGPDAEETVLHYALAQHAGRWCIGDIEIPGADGTSLRQYLGSL